MKCKLVLNRLQETPTFQYLKNNFKKVMGVIVIFLIIGCTTLRFFLMLRPKDNFIEQSSSIEFEVKEGVSTKHIAKELEERGVIKDSFAFAFLAKLKGIDSKVKAGSYLLSSSMSPKQILIKIVSGNTIKNEEKVTIPEGTRLRKVGKILEKHNLTTEEEFCKIAKAGNFKDKYKFLQELSDDTSLEGFLFPDTYLLPKNQSVEYYIDIFLKRFEEIYTKNQFDKKEIDLKIHQIITLASIIESEAKLETEKPIIASVFYNRLEKQMPLQSCSTVNYALNDYKELLTKDTKVESPYNTYLHLGLPPGPICSPGVSAIKAVFSPAKSNYLYFVSKGDGSHKFSKTYVEHKTAKNNIKKLKRQLNK